MAERAVDRILARYRGPYGPSSPDADTPQGRARQKARERLRDGPAVRWQGATALVPSASTPGRRYEVTPDDACTCEAAEHNNPICWHREARRLLVERGQAPRAARAALPANVRYVVRKRR